MLEIFFSFKWNKVVVSIPFILKIIWLFWCWCVTSCLTQKAQKPTMKAWWINTFPVCHRLKQNPSVVFKIRGCGQGYREQVHHIFLLVLKWERSAWSNIGALNFATVMLLTLDTFIFVEILLSFKERHVFLYFSPRTDDEKHKHTVGHYLKKKQKHN